ncbi:hypothetical protein [Phaffia rhodozyma]|uniref:Polysaccharide lyase 14 domain-containing protein n=1 Tax=Phaffia rhodozyma TaxID=264483 RepID=A0A0F7SSR6_PHARH|nr:hypothetical protein [Phaffia rhodozyma]
MLQLLLPLLLAVPSTVIAQTSPQALITQYALSETYTYAQPTKELDSNQTVKYLKENWSINRNRIQTGSEYISFVDDPFDSSDNQTVLQVNYMAGSYGGSGDGGAQFYSQPLNSTNSTGLTSMLLSYDVAFDSDFIFNEGGKLPGLRGGSDIYGCSGGSEANGTTCFSARLMWRSVGQGEVYAYIPTSGYDLCTSTNVICNSDYGTSLSRGSFTFSRGGWNNIQLFVQYNNPVHTANGKIIMFVNDTLVLSHTDLLIRSSTNLASIGGLFFSTFFGGSDSSYASTQNQTTYYRNFALKGSTLLSDGAGSTVKSGAQSKNAVLANGWIAFMFATVALVCSFVY